MSLKGKIYECFPMPIKIKYDILKKVKTNEQRKYEIKDNRPKIYIIGESDNGNVGDLAITLLHYKIVRESLNSNVEIVRILYSNFWEYFQWLKDNIHSQDLITIPGGGNIGDVYVEAEMIRQIIINEFPNNQIIIFPSTVYFQDRSKKNELYSRSFKIYNKHRNVTLYVRENYSYEFVKKNYPKCKAELMPDIVLSYRYDEEYTRKNEILLCIRNDVERILTEKQINEIYEICEKQCDKVMFTDTFVPNIYADCDEIRYEVVTKKLDEFAKARLIITDRLHGMILAYISKTPCVVLSNNNYKIKGVYEWIKEEQGIEYIDDICEIEGAIKKVENHFYTKKIKSFSYKKLVDQLRQWEEK